MYQVIITIIVIFTTSTKTTSVTRSACLQPVCIPNDSNIVAMQVLLSIVSRENFDVKIVCGHLRLTMKYGVYRGHRTSNLLCGSLLYTIPLPLQ